MYEFAGHTYFDGSETGDELRSLVTAAAYNGFFESNVNGEVPEIDDNFIEYMVENVESTKSTKLIAAYTNQLIVNKLSKPYEKHWLDLFETLQFEASIIEGFNMQQVRNASIARALISDDIKIEAKKFIGSLTNSKYLVVGQYSSFVTKDNKTLMIMDSVIQRWKDTFPGSFFDPATNTIYVKYSPSENMQPVYILNREIHRTL